MIKRTTLFASLFLALFTGGVIFKAFYSSRKIKSIEAKLNTKVSLPSHDERYSSKQMRSGVSKDLWISDHENGRLHYHIETPRSILTAVPHGNRVELVEQMIGMKCYLQEKIKREEGKPVQTIRYIESENGTYRYTNHQFDAQNVFLSLHRIPGKTLPTTLDPKDAYFKGIAEKATLSITKDSPNFHAEKFKGQVRP